MNATTACALLVKTPGHSPVKTRLASSIGEKEAHRFHRLSAQAMAESLGAAARRFPDRLSPYWAVAEPGAAVEWKGFPVVDQTEGEFGERLGHLYRTLGTRHRSVVLAAADSPEATTGVWLGAWRALQRPGSVMGPAADGGFYLVGSNLPVPETLWREVPYGSDRAGRYLAEGLAKLGPVRWLPLLDDIDVPSDLDRLFRRLAAAQTVPKELAPLARWALERREETDATRLPG